MQLKCKINGQEFNCSIIQGIPFSDEYNETLDSASIIIDQVRQIKNINPYDDVYIYDAEFDFKGFNKNGLLIYKNLFLDYNGYLVNKNNRFVNEKGKIVNEENKILKCNFYKHFLIDQINDEILILNTNELDDHGENKNLYKYKIQLFSEAKGLETIQLPNISITQPLNPKKKITIYEYLQKFINLYSPKIKVAIEGTDEWEYKNKYKLSSNLDDIMFETETTMEEVFGKCYSPDFILNSPNLRDVLSKFMIVKDRIPYVYNNVIYALDITKRTQEFDMSKGEIGYIYGSLSSSNYADNLKTNYINALSQDKTCKMVEYLGFRNSNTPLMKIEDLRLETGYPIYKINKVLLCYYKKCKILTSKKDKDGKFYTDVEQKAFLCKQDITKLVKLNSERNLLSKDFNELMNEKDVTSIDDMAKYRVCTVGYDIGSKYITGWGERFTYIKNDITWWKHDKTYIENITEKLDQINAFGTYTYGYVAKDLDENQALMMGGKLFADILPDTKGDDPKLERGTLISPFTNVSSALKGFFFQVEYDGFYNGTVLTTKDGAKTDIVINDNQSNSLPLLEEDGLAKKEKINRFGNKAYTISVRYKNIKDLQPLGSYFPKDDVVIYHREYSINANVINCTYYGMKDYVLKNFFTSVYAKHRPYNLMSYEESITRAENRKNLFLLSKNEEYYENNQFSIQVKNTNEKSLNNLLFSCFVAHKQEDIPSIEYIKQKDRINYAYINSYGIIYDKEGKEISRGYNNYASDINAFVNGNSLCFNLKMYDNVSMGVYINQHEPFYNRNEYVWHTIVEPQDSISGSQQNWYMTVDDIETGFSKDMGFYVCHLDQQKFFSDELMPFKEIEDYTGEGEANEALETYYNNLFKLPLIDLKDDNYQEKNVIGNTFEINKDNKEIIDMTYQFEPITSNDDILFSPLFFKLSDLYGNYNKFEEDLKIEDKKILDGETWNEAMLKTVSQYSYVMPPGTTTISQEFQVINISMQIDKEMIENKKELKLINFPIIIESDEFKNYELTSKGYVIYFKFEIQDIDIHYSANKGNEYIKLHGIQTVYTNKNTIAAPNLQDTDKYLEENTIILRRITPDDLNPVEEGKILFSNVKKTEDDPKIGSYGNYAILEPITFNGGSNQIYSSKCLIQNFKQFSQNVILSEEITTQNAKYAQNMFVVGKKEKLKKNLVYDEEPKMFGSSFGSSFVSSDILKNVNVSDVFSVDDNAITVNLSDISDDVKSLQLWYLDGIFLDKYYQPNYTNAVYKFVFGVNLTKEDHDKGEVKIYISQLSSLNKKVYDENYNFVGEIYNYCEGSKVEENLKITSTVKNNNLKTIFPLWYYENSTKYKNIKIDKNILNCTAQLTIPSINGTSIGTENIKVTYEINVNEDGTISLIFDNSRLPIQSIDLTFDEEENAYVSNIDMSKFDSKIVSLYWNETKVIFSNNYIYGTGQYYKKYEAE